MIGWILLAAAAAFALSRGGSIPGGGVQAGIQTAGGCNRSAPLIVEIGSGFQAHDHGRDQVQWWTGDRERPPAVENLYAPSLDDLSALLPRREFPVWIETGSWQSGVDFDPRHDHRVKLSESQVRALLVFGQITTTTQPGKRIQAEVTDPESGAWELVVTDPNPDAHAHPVRIFCERPGSRTL